MKKKILSIILAAVLGLTLAGCDKIQIFEKKEELALEVVKEGELTPDIFYVKTGTNFSPVYLPETKNFSSASKTIDKSRVVWFYDDEFMMPEHYSGEIIAYASTDLKLNTVILERFEDMGYSFGIYGGKMEDDGYYHFSVSNNTIEGSEARRLFGATESDNIRIVSIGNTSLENHVDPKSGIITGLREDNTYTVEFYSGTYYYRATFTADTHMMRPFEVYKYGSDYLSDTTHGYMSFSTPTDLKSGYYYINGAGFFKYHNYEKGTLVENEDYNIGYYESEEDAMASYTQQYDVSVPQTTRNMIISVNYGGVNDVYDSDIEVKGFVTAPDGTEYEMVVDPKYQTMTLNMDMAMAGDWIVNIIPKSLNVSSVDVTSDDIFEDTTCYEQEMVVEEDESFQMFYAEVDGDINSTIRGTIIAEDGVTYVFSEGKTKDGNNEKRYLFCKMPYLKAGTYQVKIYYYKSSNSIKNLKLVKYDDTSSDVFIIEDDGQVYEKTDVEE